MGLDMYLEKKTYVQNWKHTPKEEINIITIKQDGKIRKDIDTKRIKEIVEEVGYWRKANAIHKWFVDNCADDDYKGAEIYVDGEKLKKLLEVVNKVLIASKLVKGKIKNGQRSTPTGWEDVMEDGFYVEDSTVAQELLPTESGFFFGGTDYNEYYIEDLKYTKELIEGIVEKDKELSGNYYYSASW
jgi:hypothetical protein